tara:strand:+ start:3872 stop:6193 length:2322 start_codon:yes stop_codon:yes gene_type:complete
MATNEELKKGQQLLKDQIEEVGFLDNAFKTLSATITSAIDDAIDSMSGLDDITKKVAKSYQQDITASIKKSTKTLEDQVALQVKINAGKNVGKEIEDKLATNSARRQITLKKIEQLEGISNKQKRQMLESANDVFKAEEAALKTLKKNNEERQKGKSLFEIAKENAGDLADKIDKSGTLSMVLNKGIGSVLTTARMLELAVLGVFNAMIQVDKQNGELAKNLNISISEAAELSTELSEAANKSGALSITTQGLGEALMAANGELGIFNTTIDDNLILFQKLHKTAGLTYEELSGIKSITDATGGDLETNTKELLAQARLTGQRFGVALNEKDVLKDISQVSKATTLSLGMSTKELANAVSTAKALGMELSNVEGIADSILDFESSIEKELEAELLLGKNINLEKARQAALNNDLATVAEEIAKQAGSAADFAQMNRIQQQALADAVGMSREELASSLFIQEQIGNLTGEEFALREKQIKELQAEGLSQDEIKAKLGKQSIEDLKNQNSVQENLNKSIAKAKEAFVSIAAPLMQLITPIVELLVPAIEMISFLLVPVSEAFQGISGILTGNIESLSTMSTILGGIAITAGTFYATMQGISAVQGVITALKARDNALSLAGLGIMIKRKAISFGDAIINIVKGAYQTFGPIPFVGAIIAAAAAATGIAYLASQSKKGNDIMSPGSNTSGYGNRTLFGPEGAIALNNKDTVIAGTNLFRGNDVVSAPAGAIQMPDNSESKKTNSLLEALINKPAPKVQMDSIEVGTVAGMSAFSIQ